MTPDWTTAPTWAQYTAMDSDGSWHWFQHQPQYGFGFWSPSRLGGRVQLVDGMTGVARASVQTRPAVAP